MSNRTIVTTAQLECEAEREQLRAENTRLHEDYRTQNKCIADQHEEIDRLRAENAALRQDAERLRQMRSLFSGNWEAVEVILDAAIDAAREEGK